MVAAQQDYQQPQLTIGLVIHGFEVIDQLARLDVRHTPGSGIQPGIAGGPSRVRFRLPAVDRAGGKGRNAARAGQKWPLAENDAC